KISHSTRIRTLAAKTSLRAAASSRSAAGAATRFRRGARRSWRLRAASRYLSHAAVLRPPPAAMICAISGEVPDEPVVCKKSGLLFERRLIERYIEDHGKCPVTKEELTMDDIVPVKTNKV
ncbi:unnamed protein product, partial [Urochloa humidicola]